MQPCCGSLGRDDMFCAQEAVHSASLAPSQPWQVGVSCSQNFLSFHGGAEQGQETLGAGASPAEPHGCSREHGWVRWHRGHGPQGPEVRRAAEFSLKAVFPGLLD